MSSYLISVPATSANLGPGYDTLGLALNLRMRVEAMAASNNSVEVFGEGADLLPINEKNLILSTFRTACQKQGHQPPTLALKVHNPIPISRGLGSSATAIVCGLALFQLILRGEFDKDELFQQASLLEGHADNVAPAIYGGLCICESQANHFHFARGNLSPAIKVLIVVPDVLADTKAMRKILPATWPEEDLIANQSLLQRLLQGLEHARAEDLRCSQMDRIHQPYRFKANPVSHRLFKVMCATPGIAGAFLSGSGACVAGWVLENDNPVPALKKVLKETSNLAIHLLEVDHEGVMGTCINS